jgi:hypothetical protein
MAVQDLTPTNSGTNGVAAAITGKMAVFKKTIDCAVDDMGAGDVAKVFNIPANVRITNVTVNVLTAEGAAETVDVGDYTTATDAAIDADGFHDGLSINSEAATQSAGNGAEYEDGKVYTAATAYLGILFPAAATVAKIQVVVEMVNYQ